MKKFIGVVLTLIMIFAMTAIASANNIASYVIYNMPCEKISDSQIYQYRADEDTYVEKEYDNNVVQISHYVTQIDADETNRIAAYDGTTNKTMGANWHPADNHEYPCTSNAISAWHFYTASGRGNTNYETKYGLNSITIRGHVNSNDDAN
ncbi:MAG: hypothetical protein ACI3W5_01005 [Faecousia sp.]